jgi:phytanoyl-CoA hydroxylase
MPVPRFAPSEIGSPAFRDAWHRDGVVVVDSFWSLDEVALARRQATALRASCAAEAPGSVFDAQGQDHGNDAWFRESGSEIRAFFEPGTPPDLTGRARARWVNKLGHALHDRDPVFAALLQSDRIAQLAHALDRPAGLMVQSMLIFKEAGIGDAVPPHQDAAFIATEPPSVIGLWIALDDATAENGALQVAAGAHRGPLRTRYRRDGERLWTETLDATPLEEPDEVVAARPGTLVAFDGRLSHGSLPNTSTRPRWAVTAHIVSHTATWSADNWLVRADAFPRLPEHS